MYAKVDPRQPRRTGHLGEAGRLKAHNAYSDAAVRRKMVSVGTRARLNDPGQPFRDRRFGGATRPVEANRTLAHSKTVHDVVDGIEHPRLPALARCGLNTLQRMNRAFACACLPDDAEPCAANRVLRPHMPCVGQAIEYPAAAGTSNPHS